MTDHAWRDHAACRGHDPELWFPDQRSQQAQALQALSICATCPVRVNCTQEAQRLDGVCGIWGGQHIPIVNARRYRSPLPSSGRAPCGTTAAHRRHQRHGETPCRACTDAQREYRNTRKNRTA